MACTAVAALLVGLLPATPAPAAPPVASFPPGIWKGLAVVTGGISGQGVEAFITSPIIVNFQVEVAPDASVVDGGWAITGAAASAVDAGGEGSFEFSGGGGLAGTGSRVVLAGSVSMVGSVTVQGSTYAIEFALDAAGGFSPSTATCSFVTGDIATEARDVQTASGFATTVTGPFTAHRIGNVGDNLAPDFEEQYVALVEQMDELVAQVTPAAADVVDLAAQAEAFYLNVFANAHCPGGTPNLAPGKQPYTYFVKQLGQLLLAALAHPEAYSAEDLHVLALAAIRIGVVGAAAPDPDLAAQVRQALFDAIAGSLSAAVAAQDQADCLIIHLAASAMGFAELLADAHACANGA